MKIVLANRLTDGRVVFLTNNGTWTPTVAHASVLADNDAEDTALVTAKVSVADNIVVDPYAIDVRLDAGRPVPLRLRERIRVYGPTVGSDVTETVAAA